MSSRSSQSPSSSNGQGWQPAWQGATPMTPPPALPQTSGGYPGYQGYPQGAYPPSPVSPGHYPRAPHLRPIDLPAASPLTQPMNMQSFDLGPAPRGSVRAATPGLSQRSAPQSQFGGAPFPPASGMPAPYAMHTPPHSPTAAQVVTFHPLLRGPNASLTYNVLFPPALDGPNRITMNGRVDLHSRDMNQAGVVTREGPVRLTFVVYDNMHRARSLPWSTTLQTPDETTNGMCAKFINTLATIFESLQHEVSPRELQQFDGRLVGQATQARARRFAQWGMSPNSASPLLRIDFLLGSTMFAGLAASPNGATVAFVPPQN